MSPDTATFEAHRPALTALAYRMVGDLARAEDIVQEAWIRWQGRDVDVEAPRAYLGKIVTRLCLNELASARARKEESRGDRLPEPIDLDDTGIGRLETIDQVSMAFLVVLQRLTPAERAVFLLHEVFEQSHAEIAVILQRTEAACRQLLSRARENVATERRVLHAPPDEHSRLVAAFVRAATGGEYQGMIDLLAEESTLIIDAGPNATKAGRIRNVGRPVYGAKRIATFLVAVSQQSTPRSTAIPHILNGQPAIVMMREGRAVAAILVSVADGKIRHVFVHADAARLTRLGPLN